LCTAGISEPPVRTLWIRRKPLHPNRHLRANPSPAASTAAGPIAREEKLAQDVTHARRRPSEKSAFTTVAGLGIDTVEAVLLYHVIPGATIDARTALASNGAELTTAAGSTITVRVTRSGCVKRITLIDADHNDRNPTVVKADINKGNKQIAHAIDRVLRPIDLP
jgi:hypothetical protein